MKGKSIITALLTLFVLASVVTLVRKEAASHAPPGSAEGTPVSGTKLVAYYLHGKVRCVTCNEIEKSAREAVESGFKDQLESGRVEWRVVNYEEPGNEHFASDFQLAAPCVVLACFREGRQEKWRSLPEVWELIGDKDAFRSFVVKSVREELGELPRAELASGPTIQVVDVALPSSPEETRQLPKLLDIGSTRCIPCKEMAPILKELKETYREKLDVAFIDLLEDSSAAEKYGISTMPTQIFFDASGKELFRHEGFFSREEILSKWHELGVELESNTKS